MWRTFHSSQLPIPEGVKRIWVFASAMSSLFHAGSINTRPRSIRATRSVVLIFFFLYQISPSSPRAHSHCGAEKTFPTKIFLLIFLLMGPDQARGNGGAPYLARQPSDLHFVHGRSQRDHQVRR